MGNKFSVAVCCVSKAVRVLQPDGTVIVHTGDTLSVADLLLQFPHHYVCQGGVEGRCMLPLEMELKPGHKYFLLPLPRLFSVATKRFTPSQATFSRCFWFPGCSFQVADNEESELLRPGRSLCTCTRLGIMNNCCTGLLRTLSSNNLIKHSPERTMPMATDMHDMIKSAEIVWKEMNELSKTLAWKPDLESIKEEQSPFRQTLRFLMSSSD